MKTSVNILKFAKNTSIAIFFYLFIWKKDDMSIFTKKEKFIHVCKGELKAEK